MAGTVWPANRSDERSYPRSVTIQADFALRFIMIGDLRDRISYYLVVLHRVTALSIVYSSILYLTWGEGTKIFWAMSFRLEIEDIRTAMQIIILKIEWRKLE